ncbi:MAG: 16S rRNA (uracil(1498)-N(3))-methyltransferase [Syntrophomonas sp.]
MHRFFVSADNIKDDIVYIDAFQTRHIEKVLRLKPGDSVMVFDGLGTEYQVKLLKKESDMLLAEIEKKNDRQHTPAVNLTLVQGIAKGDKMDTIIQKAVEIGVKTIVPLQSEHTVVRIDGEKAGKKLQRWQAIAREACKQCRRNYIPEIKPVMDFQGLMFELSEKPVIMLYENEEKTRLGTVLKDHKDRFEEKGIFLLVGPEGGFSRQEVRLAQNHNVILAGLGPGILRTETAGLAAASIILYEFGDLG